MAILRLKKVKMVGTDTRYLAWSIF